MTMKELHPRRRGQAQHPRYRADERFRRARLALLETELELHAEAGAERPPTPGEVARARWFEGERVRLTAAA